MRILALILMLLPVMAAADPARLDLGGSSLVKTGRGWFGGAPLELTLALTDPVPYRVFVVGDPARLVVDMQGVDLAGQDVAQMFGADLSPAIRWGVPERGWSRLVVELPGTYHIDTATQITGAAPQIRITLAPVSERDFAPRPSATAALRGLPDPAELPDVTRQGGFIVMLDPGHGGFDPGAQAAGVTEAELVLTFAHELRAVLENQGVTVKMTRDDDRFVSLENRMTAARQAGAHLFLSIHADALPQGQAAGATVYTWNPNANSQAARQLAERHDRADLLAGMDLSGHDDALATALMGFARTDTQPRSETFARHLTSRMALMGIGLHGRPVQGAAFSVLKSPDIPSVLLELGFISDNADLTNMTDPDWRARMAVAVSEAVLNWSRDEQARADLLRR
ncbi:N-acetylmuramoyl-L-alanine amidase [Paracoccus sp. (in: a-proteobacteria)]|uniref:N-acetylmuramoyl-L-alanine amidase n=1 Tax=Paracoccus sp. TaxID=267 RepID=UPI0026E05C2B|nr:N-acetylmuramoyl-L-alanine amidase [Paracoccus sp. (in: a-proteobacteria)]MDO5646865.1 N-acetylmuramoyl-L-alanine amidase [Paracoccus sp. (in: a-proteobacteria)]